MNSGLLGSQIAGFRKALGMTQEELGNAVGVSTQAVSRWECGGAPDISLLPSIADTLRVSVDALFGRESGEPSEIGKAVFGYLSALRQEELLNALTELMWPSCLAFFGKMFGEIPTVGPVAHCEAFHQGHNILIRSVLTHDSGLLIGSYAEDMKFMLAFPEPEDGYGRFLGENDGYRRLFAVLALPGALELLRAMAMSSSQFVTAAFLAGQTGLPMAEVSSVLDALVDVRILDRSTLELETGPVFAYSTFRMDVLIPFLYFARYLYQEGSPNFIGCLDRDKPWLRREAPHEKA